MKQSNLLIIIRRPLETGIQAMSEQCFLQILFSIEMEEIILIKMYSQTILFSKTQGKNQKICMKHHLTIPSLKINQMYSMIPSSRINQTLLMIPSSRINQTLLMILSLKIAQVLSMILLSRIALVLSMILFLRIALSGKTCFAAFSGFKGFGLLKYLCFFYILIIKFKEYCIK